MSWLLPFFLGAALLLDPSGAAPLAGRAYHYQAYPSRLSMRAVAARRGIPLDWAADGYAATRRCDRIGWYVRARVAGQRVTLQQIDCSDPRDLAYQAAIGDVLETDYSLAADQGWAWGAGGPGHTAAVVYGYFRHPQREERK